MMTVLAAIGGFIVLNHIIMLMWTHMFNGEDWFDGEDYIALTLIRWFQIGCILCVLALARWVVQEVPIEAEAEAEAIQTHCVQIEDNTPAEEPIQY